MSFGRPAVYYNCFSFAIPVAKNFEYKTDRWADYRYGEGAIAWNGYQHALFGGLLWWVLHDMHFGVAFYLLPMILGAVFPDADHPKAPAGRMIPLWLVFKHRTFTHTLWGLLLFSGFWCLLFGISGAISFATGYLTHLLTDALTPMGIRWWGKRAGR